MLKLNKFITSQIINSEKICDFFLLIPYFVVRFILMKDNRYRPHERNFHLEARLLVLQASSKKNTGFFIFKLFQYPSLALVIPTLLKCTRTRLIIEYM
jgi:hypothetical protein